MLIRKPQYHPVLRYILSFDISINDVNNSPSATKLRADSWTEQPPSEQHVNIYLRSANKCYVHCTLAMSTAGSMQRWGALLRGSIVIHFCYTALCLTRLACLHDDFLSQVPDALALVWLWWPLRPDHCSKVPQNFVVA